MFVLFLTAQPLPYSRCLSFDELLWAPPYCVLRQIVSLNLSFLKCKLEMATPTCWVAVKTKSRECLVNVAWSVTVDLWPLLWWLWWLWWLWLIKGMPVCSGYTDFLLPKTINVSHVQAKMEVTSLMLLIVILTNHLVFMPGWTATSMLPCHSDVSGALSLAECSFSFSIAH